MSSVVSCCVLFCRVWHIYFLPDPLRECLLFPILAAIPVATPAPIISEAIKGSLCSVSSFSWLFVISFKSAKFKRKILTRSWTVLLIVTDHKVCITVNTFSLFSSQFRSTFGGVAMERNTYELKIILYRKLVIRLLRFKFTYSVQPQGICNQQKWFSDICFIMHRLKFKPEFNKWLILRYI